MKIEKTTIEPIGIIYSCYPEKFGIPRQPGMVKSSTARLVLQEPYNRIEMVKCLDEFSHIWVQFLFHQTVDEGWRPTIRPPFLGGKRRVGIFASRSPHRPNYLGLSVVRLLGITHNSDELSLALEGVDLLDQTPVFDIKPYIPYCDSIKDAEEGYATPPTSCYEVLFSKEAEGFCRQYELKYNRRARIAPKLGLKS